MSKPQSLLFITNEILSKIEPLFTSGIAVSNVPTSEEYRQRIYSTVIEGFFVANSACGHIHLSPESESLFDNVASVLPTSASAQSLKALDTLNNAVANMARTVVTSPMELNAFLRWNSDRLKALAQDVLAHNARKSAAPLAGEDCVCGRMLWPVTESLSLAPFEWLASESKLGLPNFPVAAHTALVATTLGLESTVRAAMLNKCPEGPVSIMLHENIRSIFCAASRELDGAKEYNSQVLGALLWCIYAHSSGMHLRNMTLHGCFLPLHTVEGDETALKQRYLHTIQYSLGMAMFGLCEVLAFFGYEGNPSASTLQSYSLRHEGALPVATGYEPILARNISCQYQPITNLVQKVECCVMLEHLLRTGGSVLSEGNRTRLGAKFVGLDSLLALSATTEHFCAETMEMCKLAEVRLALAGITHSALTIAFWLQGLFEAPMGPNLRDRLVHFKGLQGQGDADVFCTLGILVRAMSMESLELTAAESNGAQVCIEGWREWQTIPHTLRVIRELPAHFFGDGILISQRVKEWDLNGTQKYDVCVDLPITNATKAIASLASNLQTSIFPLDSLPSLVSLCDAQHITSERLSSNTLEDLNQIMSDIREGLGACRVQGHVFLSALLVQAADMCQALDRLLSSVDQIAVPPLDPSSINRATLVRSAFLEKFNTVFPQNSEVLPPFLILATALNAVFRSNDGGEGASTMQLRFPSAKEAVWAWLLSNETTILGNIRSPLDVLFSELLPRVLAFLVLAPKIVPPARSFGPGGQQLVNKQLTRTLTALADTIIRALGPVGKKPSGLYRSASHSTVGLVVALMDLLTITLDC